MMWENELKENVHLHSWTSCFDCLPVVIVYLSCYFFIYGWAMVHFRLVNRCREGHIQPHIYSSMFVSSLPVPAFLAQQKVSFPANTWSCTPLRSRQKLFRHIFEMGGFGRVWVGDQGAERNTSKIPVFDPFLSACGHTPFQRRFAISFFIHFRSSQWTITTPICLHSVHGLIWVGRFSPQIFWYVLAHIS